MTGKSWTRIDAALARKLLIGPDDFCYYYLVRTPGGYDASSANSMIANFKKDLERFGKRPEVMRYKDQAIEDLSCALGDFLNGPYMQTLAMAAAPALLVPMPTSIPRTHEFYDYRLDALCDKAALQTRGINARRAFDVRYRMESSHTGGTRSISDLRGAITFSGFSQVPGMVILVDDVITTGSHYVVCRDLVRARYPNTLVIGLFLAIHRSDKIDYGSVGLHTE